ncbi:MAG: hypothetical protein LBJ69_00415 [Holosporales bacterium]|jgi:hypothetical protein|nr:hypothetical protein [Holosporales bacterium]
MMKVKIVLIAMMMNVACSATEYGQVATEIALNTFAARAGYIAWLLRAHAPAEDQPTVPQGQSAQTSGAELPAPGIPAEPPATSPDTEPSANPPSLTDLGRSLEEFGESAIIQCADLATIYKAKIAIKVLMDSIPGSDPRDGDPERSGKQIALVTQLHCAMDREVDRQLPWGAGDPTPSQATEGSLIPTGYLADLCADQVIDIAVALGMTRLGDDVPAYSPEDLKKVARVQLQGVWVYNPSPEQLRAAEGVILETMDRLREVLFELGFPTDHIIGLPQWSDHGSEVPEEQ